MKQYKHILCPIDYADFSDKTLQTALALRDLYSAKLSVVHFVEPLPAVAINAYSADVELNLVENAREAMAEYGAKYKLAADEMHILEEHPKFAINNAAKDMGADLIVIGRHGHHGIMGSLLGSTAAAVANHAPCDVFVVRAD